jgi:hypothetical protein
VAGQDLRSVGWRRPRRHGRVSDDDPGRLRVCPRPHSAKEAVVDSPCGQSLLGKLADKGIVGLAYGDLGFRYAR